jgi:hypothetical protein
MPTPHLWSAAVFAVLSVFAEYWMIIAKRGVLFAESRMMPRRSPFAAIGKHGYSAAHQRNGRNCN